MLDSNFYLVFGGWFIVDDIDLSNSEEVEDNARTCAVDLINKLYDPGKLIADLTEVLDKWEPETIRKFIRASNIDWKYDKKTEDILRDVINIMIDELKAQPGRQIES
ncbi:MAG: hypothetical protein J2P41_06760 [Blastocatellia bacterium]|nr:hypothetical protein [Blastocatellia bacterium]